MESRSLKALVEEASLAVTLSPPNSLLTGKKPGRSIGVSVAIRQHPPFLDSKGRLATGAEKPIFAGQPPPLRAII